MVAKGSIPLASVGPVALFLIVLVRYMSWMLSVQQMDGKEVLPMDKKAHHLRLFGQCMLETIWAIGANIVAGALPT